MSRRPIALLGLAAASVAGAFAVWLAAFHVAAGRMLDGRALVSFTGVARAPITPPRIDGFSNLVDAFPFAIAASVLVIVALLRRRWLMAATAAGILLSANLATQVLKPALADLRTFDVRGVESTYPGSWPSGHSTAAMSLALCLVLVVGPRLRPLAALVGAGFAIAVGYSLIVLGFHLPSDVLGGYLVAGTFTLFWVAGLAAAEARWPGSPAAASRTTRTPALLAAPTIAMLAVAAVGVAADVVFVLAPDATVDALEHPVAILAGLGIALLGIALTSGLARALRR